MNITKLDYLFLVSFGKKYFSSSFSYGVFQRKVTPCFIDTLLRP